MKSDKLAEKFSLKKFSKKDRFVIIAALILFGILLASLSGLFAADAKTKPEDASAGLTAQQYKESLETQLEQTLGMVKGVGAVDVMITLDGEVTKVLAYNETTSDSSSTGASSTSSTQTTTSKNVIMVESGSDATPYAIKDNYPEVVGVIVVAQGGGVSQTKYEIIQAVKTALNVPSHKIVVLTKNPN